MNIRCNMPTGHDSRCPWPHEPQGRHTLWVTSWEQAPIADRVAVAFRCSEVHCLSGTLQGAPIASVVALLVTAAQAHEADPAGQARPAEARAVSHPDHP